MQNPSEPGFNGKYSLTMDFSRENDEARVAHRRVETLCSSRQGQLSERMVRGIHYHTVAESTDWSVVMMDVFHLPTEDWALTSAGARSDFVDPGSSLR